MITVIVDKMSEVIWMDMVLKCGELNFSDKFRTVLGEYKIEPAHIIDFEKSDDFVNDIKDYKNELDK